MQMISSEDIDLSSVFLHRLSRVECLRMDHASIRWEVTEQVVRWGIVSTTYETKWMNQDSILVWKVSVLLFPPAPYPHSTPLVILVKVRLEARALETVGFFKVNERVQ